MNNVDSLLPQHVKLDEALTKFSHGLPVGLIELIQEHVLGSKSFLSREESFRLDLVLDTNIAFQEVRSLVVRKKSFLLKLIENPLLRIYAPTKLKEELISKIKLKFPRDNKTKNIDINECIKQAESFLDKIEIRDDIKDEAQKKATEIMEERDQDDISFVALNMSLASHGILTYDKDIRDQENIKTWELKDVGRVITQVHKGSLSFVVLGTVAAPIFEIILKILGVVWNATLNLINGFLKLIGDFAKGTLKTVQDIPNEILVVFGFVLLIILLDQKLRDNVTNVFKEIWKQIKLILERIKYYLLSLWQKIKVFYNELIPTIKDVAIILSYFASQTTNAIEEINRLERATISDMDLNVQ